MNCYRYSLRVIVASFAFSVCAMAQQNQAARFSAVPQSKAVGQSLSVLEEEFRIHCEANGERLDCSSESLLKVENPTATGTHLTLEVDPYATELKVNGKVIPLVVPEGQFVQNGHVMLPPARSHIVVSIPRAIRLDASAKSAEVLTPVLVTRHPQLGQYPGRPFGAELTLQSVAVAKRWKDVRRTRIIVTYPGDWEELSKIPECKAGEVTERGCARKLDDGYVELEWVSVASSQSPTPISRLLPLAPESGLFTNGGFLFGIGWGGGNHCLDCVDAVRARAGYEVGVASHDLLAFVVEYSPTKRLVLVPSVDRAVLPNLGVIPATTVGIGLPVQVSHDLQAGIRGQASVTWPIKKRVSLGVVGMVDVLLDAKGFHSPAGVGLQMGF